MHVLFPFCAKKYSGPVFQKYYRHRLQYPPKRSNTTKGEFLMKKLLSVLCASALALTLLAGCSNAASSSTPAENTDSAACSEAAPAEEDAAADTADTAKLEAIVTAVEAVNPVSNSRALDDFSLENEIGLTLDNIVAFQGDVTNDQADCALVLAIQAKSGAADAVKAELEAYKESASSNLYAEFADKVAKAQDARIVVDGDFVVMVIAGVAGPDYSEIDTAIEGALA